MKLESFYIERFGIFSDYSVDGLSSGLSVFYGQNETGKSTLLEFIRSMLFGFNIPRGKKDSYYASVSGSARGGRIAVNNGQGLFNIERIRENKTKLRIWNETNELENPADVLASILAGADITLFKSVFAFGLGELFSLNSLSIDEVKERIFSAGILGASQSASSVIARLLQENALLLRPRASTKISEIITQLEENDVQMTFARKELLKVPLLLVEEKRLKEQTESLKKNLDRSVFQGRKLSYLLEMLPSYLQISQLKTRLTELGEIDELAEEDIRQVKELLQRKESLEERCSDLKKEFDILKDETDKLKTELKPELFENYKVIDELSRQTESQREMQINRLSMFDKCQMLNADIGNLSKHLSKVVVGSNFYEIDDSSENYQFASSALARISENSIKVESIKKRLEVEQKDHAQLMDECQAIRSSLDKLWTRKEDAIRFSVELDTLRAARERMTAEIKARREVMNKKERAFGRSLSRASIIAAVALILLSAYLFSSGVYGMGISIILVVLLIIVCLRSQSIFESLSFLFDGFFGSSSVHAQLRMFDLELRRNSESLRDILMLSSECEDAELENLINKQQSVLEEAIRLKQDLSNKEEELKFRERNINLWKKDVEDLENLVLGAKEEIRIWCEANHIKPEIDFFDVERIISEVRELKKLDREQKEINRELRNIHEAITRWEEKALVVIYKLIPSRNQDGSEVERPKGERLFGIVGSLFDAAREQCLLFERSSEQEKHLNRLSEKLIAERDCGTEVDMKLEQAFARCKTANKDEFFKTLLKFQTKSALLADIKKLEDLLASTCFEFGEEVLSELNLASPELWEEQLKEQLLIQEKLNVEIQEVARLYFQAKAEYEVISSSYDIQELCIKRQSLISELQYYVQEWKRNALSIYLIERVLEDFCRTRQPKVLAEASRYFNLVAPNYKSVIQGLEDNELLLVDQKDSVKSLDVLSRGTAEQLYLSLRLAFAAEFSKRLVELPLVMDDVFVNFDTERTERFANLLRDYSKNHQILFFTCHTWTRDMLCSSAGDVRCYNLPSA